MFGAFQTFGKLGAIGKAISAAWSPLSLWPTGTEPGMWIDPSNLDASWADYTGTTPVSPPGSVADSSNPVGLALDLRLGATALTDPGNHLLQATSTARPLVSARVNLLTYTEDFSSAVWVLEHNGTGAVPTKTVGYALAPDSTMSAARLTFSLGGGNTSADFSGVSQNVGVSGVVPPGATALRDVWFRSNTGASQNIYLRNAYSASGSSADHGELVTVTTSWQQFQVPCTQGGATGFSFTIWLRGGLSDGHSTDGDILAWHPQSSVGSTPFPYQAILTDGSTYSSTGFPIYQKYDGTDDGMATATFAAGTLSSAMDCMIAVRRDSAGNAVCGLYESVAEANKVFGIAESASGSGCVGSGAGTPTVWVDGVQLTGGTAVTRGTLHTALTVGDYHVLEFRGLDLSTWTASGFGLYTSYVLNGALGGILLFPSSTSTANRDAARTWLGTKVGLTL